MDRSNISMGAGSLCSRVRWQAGRRLQSTHAAHCPHFPVMTVDTDNRSVGTAPHNHRSTLHGLNHVVQELGLLVRHHPQAHTLKVRKALLRPKVYCRGTQTRRSLDRDRVAWLQIGQRTCLHALADGLTPHRLGSVHERHAPTPAPLRHSKHADVLLGLIRRSAGDHHEQHLAWTWTRGNLRTGRHI